jgi:hypothetical protein
VMFLCPREKITKDKRVADHQGYTEVYRKEVYRSASSKRQVKLSLFIYFSSSPPEEWRSAR